MKLCPGHERLSSDYSDWKCGAQCRFCQGTCQKCFPPEPATPTPSITVGTQVRLTGVVEPDPAEGGGGIYLRTAGGHSVYLNSSAKEDLEVIRQPFKRGEVVYFEDHNIACVVLEDEQNGRMLLIEAGEGKYATYVDADQYERRP